MIGVFDSGLGGLIVLKEIKKQNPNQAIIYLGDLANLPYGNKSQEKVTKLALKNVNFLIKKGAKKIVIACNTASAYALNKLRQKFPKIIFYDVITPAVNKALKDSKNKRLGVIGTKATIQSSAYTKAIRKKDPKIKLITQECPLLVPLIEEGWQNQPETLQILKKYLKPLQKAKIDTLILGCTHYPILKNKIKKIMGPEITIVDSAQEVAKTLKKQFKPQRKIQKIFYVTDFSPGFNKIAQKFCPDKEIRFKKVILD